MRLLCSYTFKKLNNKIICTLRGFLYIAITKSEIIKNNILKLK